MEGKYNLSQRVISMEIIREYNESQSSPKHQYGVLLRIFNLQIFVNYIECNFQINFILSMSLKLDQNFLNSPLWNSDVNMNAAFCMKKADDLGNTLSTHAKLLSPLFPKATIMVFIIHGA